MTTTELVEVASGLSEGEKIITTGAGALREGDRIVLPGRRRRTRAAPAATAAAGAADADAAGRAANAAARPAGGRAPQQQRRPRQRAPVAAEHRRLSDHDELQRQERRMSIPRFAIQRPVMMTMISSIIILHRRHLADPAAGRSAARHLAADDHASA